MAEGALGSIWTSIGLDIAPYIQSEQTVTQRMAKLDQTMQAETAKMAEHWRTLGDAVKRSMTEPLQAEQQVWQARVTMAQQGTAQQRALMEQHIAWLKTQVTNTDLPLVIRADFKRDLQQAERDLAAFEQVSKQRADAIAAQWTSLGKMLSVAITAPLVLLGRQMVNTFASFEQSLANAGAVAQATAGEMQRMEQAARQAGATTVFSAGEAADAMYYLASGGMSVSQQIDAMTGVLDLAAATQSGLADSAAVTSSVLAAFGLEAAEAGRVANVFSAAINNSMASLEKLSGGMRQVGPIAGAMGLQLEEVTAALGLLYNAGYEGAQAGTILRSAFSSLVNPVGQTKDIIVALGVSMDDLNPGLRSFGEILDTLRDSGITVAQAMAMFGDQAGPGMVQLLNQGSGALRDLQEKITGTNTAAETATRQVDTLSGSVKMLRSVLEEAYISLTQSMEPALRGIVTVATAAVEAFNRLSPSARRFITTAGAVAAAIGPLTLALVGIKTALGALAGPAGLIVAVASALAGLGAAFAGARRDQEDYSRKAVDAARANREQADRLRALIREYDSLSGKPDKSKAEHDRLKTVMEEIIKIQPDIARGYDDAGEAIDRNLPKIYEQIAALERESETYLKTQALKAQVDRDVLEARKARLESQLEAAKRDLDKIGDGQIAPLLDIYNRLRAAHVDYLLAVQEAEGASPGTHPPSWADAQALKLAELKKNIDDIITEAEKALKYYPGEGIAMGATGMIKTLRDEITVLSPELDAVARKVKSAEDSLKDVNDELAAGEEILKRLRVLEAGGDPWAKPSVVKDKERPLDPGTGEGAASGRTTNEALKAALDKFQDLLSVNSELVDTADKQIAYLDTEILKAKDLIKLERERAEVRQMIFDIAMGDARRLAAANEWNARQQLEHLDTYLAQYAVSYDQIQKLNDQRISLQATITAEDAAAADARFASAKRMYDIELERLGALAYEEERRLTVAEKQALYWRIMDQHGRTNNQFTKEAVRANAAMELQFEAERIRELKDLKDEELRIEAEAANALAKQRDEDFRRAMDLYDATTVGKTLSLREQQRIFNDIMNDMLKVDERSAEAHQAIAYENLVFMRGIAAEEVELAKRIKEEKVQLAIETARTYGDAYAIAQKESELKLAQDLEMAKGNLELIAIAHKRHQARVEQAQITRDRSRSDFTKNLLQNLREFRETTVEDDLLDLYKEMAEKRSIVRSLGLEEDYSLLSKLQDLREREIRQEHAERAAQMRIDIARKTEDALDIEEGRNLTRRLTTYETVLKYLEQETDAYKEFANTVTTLRQQVTQQEAEASRRSADAAVEAAKIRAGLADDIDAEQKAALEGLDHWRDVEQKQLNERFLGTAALHKLLLNAESLYQAKREEIIQDFEARRQDAAYNAAQQEYQARIRGLQTKRATMDIPASERRALFDEVLAAHMPETGWGAEASQRIKDTREQLDVQIAIARISEAKTAIEKAYEASIRQLERKLSTTDISPGDRLVYFLAAVDEALGYAFTFDEVSGIISGKSPIPLPAELDFDELRDWITTKVHDLWVESTMFEDETHRKGLQDVFGVKVLQKRLAGAQYEADRDEINYRYYTAEKEADRKHKIDPVLGGDSERRRLALERDLALLAVDRRELEDTQSALRDAVLKSIESFGPIDKDRTIEEAKRFAEELRASLDDVPKVLKPRTENFAEDMARLYDEVGSEVKLALAEIDAFSERIANEEKRRIEDLRQWLLATGQMTAEQASVQAWEAAKERLSAAEAEGVGIEEARQALARAEFDLNRTMIDTLRAHFEYRNEIENAHAEKRLERARTLIDMEASLMGEQAENHDSYRQSKLEELELLQEIQAAKTENHLADLANGDETLASLEEQIRLLEAYRDVIEELGPVGAKALELVIQALDATDAKLKQAKRSAKELRKEFDTAMAPDTTEAEQMRAWIIAKATAYRDAGIAIAEVGRWMDMQWQQFLDRQRQGTKDFWADWRVEAVHTMLGPMGGLFDAVQRAWHTTYDYDEETGERYSKIAKAFEPFLKTPLIEALVEGGQKVGKELLWAIGTGWAMVKEAVPRWISGIPRFLLDMFRPQLQALRQYIDESGIIGGLWRGLDDVVQGVLRMPADLWHGFQKTTGIDLSGWLFPWFREFMVENLGSLFRHIWQTISGFFRSGAEALRPYIEESGIIGGLWRGALDALRYLGESLSSMAGAAMRFLRLDYDEGLFSDQRQYLSGVLASLIERMAGIFGGVFESEIMAFAGYIRESGILGGIWRATKDVVSGLARGLQSLWEKLEDATGLHLSSLVHFFDFLLENWWSLFKRIFNVSADMFGPPLAALKQYMEESGVLVGLWRGVKDVVVGLAAGFASVWRDIEELTGFRLSAVVEVLVGWAKEIATAIGDKLKWLWDKVLPHLWESAKALGSALAQSLVAIVGPLGDVFLKLAEASEPLQTVWKLLGEMFQALANVVGELLLPVFKLLWPVLRGFAWVVAEVALIIGSAWNALAWAINRMLGWLGVNIEYMDTAAIKESRNQIGGIAFPDPDDSSGKGKAGLQVMRMTGETRDVFVELLRPLTTLNIMPGLFDNVLQRLDAILDTLRGVARGVGFEVNEAVITIMRADIVVQSAGTVALQGPVTLNLPKQDLDAQATAAMRAGGV